MRSHEADRGRFTAWARGTPEERALHELDATLHDAVATHLAARYLGDLCASVRTVDACSPPETVTFLDDPDRALQRTRTLLDGLRGGGPCTMERVNRRDGCFNLELHSYVGDLKLEMVREGWTAPAEKRSDPTSHAMLAAVQMAWWRAVIDYGVAVLPVCAPRAAASCERLREGLTAASPDTLAVRVRQLHAAAQDGTPCPTSVPAGDEGATR